MALELTGKFKVETSSQSRKDYVGHYEGLEPHLWNHIWIQEPGKLLIAVFWGLQLQAFMLKGWYLTNRQGISDFFFLNDCEWMRVSETCCTWAFSNSSLSSSSSSADFSWGKLKDFFWRNHTNKNAKMSKWRNSLPITKLIEPSWKLGIVLITWMQDSSAIWLRQMQSELREINFLY